MITVQAPEGIGEVTPDTDLAAVVAQACTVPPVGGLVDGDVLVVTSKIISKLEGRSYPTEQKLALQRGATVRTVARKLGTAIVATRHGLIQAAAGIDASNVAKGSVLLLPDDPDASARTLRTRLIQLTGANVAVVISDTAGRAWRIGQTDHAIGCAGLRPLLSFDHAVDAYGNELRVTLTAVADEITAAADLAKGKLGGRPVAVLRGLAEHVVAADEAGDPARTLTRPVDEDLFSHGSRESVLAALLTMLGAGDRYEELVMLDDVDAVIDALEINGPRSDWARELLTTAYQLFG